MANVLNPAAFGWQFANKFSDGTAFTAANYAGTEVQVDGKVVTGLTVPFATDGKYQIPASAFGALATGTHAWAVRLLATNGTKSALVSGPAFDVDTRVPADPFGLTVS
jgi:hypothetical protein